MWNSLVVYLLYDYMSGFRIMCNKVLKGIMSVSFLRNIIMWFWFNCMDKIRKFNSILDKEYGYIIIY